MKSILLSDTEGEITSLLVVYERDGIIPPFDLESSLLGYFTKNADFDFFAYCGNYFTSDFEIGGIRDKHLDRIFFPKPLYIDANYRGAGFRSACEFEKWLKSRLPFSKVFSKLVYPTGDVVDISQLYEVIDRLKFCRNFCNQNEVSFHNSNGEEYWKFVNNLGVTIETERVVTTTVPSNIEKHIIRKECLLKLFFDRNDQNLNWDECFGLTKFEVRKFRSITQKLRKARISTDLFHKLPEFAQDQFIVRTVNGQSKIGIKRGDISSTDFQQYVKLCQLIFPSISWDFNTDCLRTQGGNMFVSKNIVFIGKDEFVKYSDNNGQKEEILKKTNAEVLSKVFDGASEKFIIWVGTKKKGHSRYPDYDTFIFQPAYHIDLFFCPLGFLDTDEPSEITFLFGQPEFESMALETDQGEQNLNDAEKSKMQSLIKWFKNCFTKLVKDVQGCGFKANPIKVPLGLILWKPNGSLMIKRYSPFVNGLVNQKTDVVEYLMPAIVNWEEHLLFSAVQMKTILQIRNIVPNVKIRLVKDEILFNGRDSGLRCRVKVVKRII